MDGILLLHKPKGMTSHDCVFKVRKLLKMKKVGHTGTLDPDVSGVLPICLGRATKIVEFITAEDKTYVGEVTLGYSTTTEDSSGDIVSEKKVDRVISKSEIEDVFMSLTGEITQTPPMYSAVKVNGKRLYEYARKGIEVERPSRNIHIHELVLLDGKDEYKGDTVSFRFKVTCSKGTYVRTLAVQIGEKLGFPAHMSDLTRISSGNFLINQCISLSEVEQKVQDHTINTCLISIEDALLHLPNVMINDKVAEKVKNGAVLPLPEGFDHILTAQPIAIQSIEKQILAIYQRHPEKNHLIKPIKVLVNNQELI
ncbi:tRNA pseudouridine(55) synthase TruB [Fredinandcohnia quinoae]|uniref:tRNA pseudouridine synthase B n=1 Tax=Fredinandcohnia quinoae TaxID=2918902 RepID=A0AAW5E2D7_9BACI|nr:tRNA pseudouridine(55) synthase TruB [Fredinandcohnia sp. SECRCQ15]MCH1623740.1 tRNA pseudouridine(55) synthase TruB [Fredinandcohnia sp. SECRCQ15]